MIPSAYPDPQTVARLTAAMLLDVGAVHLRPDDPFTLSSGEASPTYVDCRALIGYPRLRSQLMDFLACTVMRAAGAEAFDVVAGGETAGIPFAALIAERLALPMAYVRKVAKGHGRGARIEGRAGPGDRVLLVEDLATDGGSKLSFVDGLREAGARCAHTAVIFSYGIFPQTGPMLARHGVTLHALCTWHDVLTVARARGDLPPEAVDAVARFLDDPDGWRAARRE